MSVIPGFDPSICDLCGARDYSRLLHLHTDRAMRSDRQIVAARLSKLACTSCGLVRSGERLDGQALEDYYTHEYTLSTQPVEYYFYTPHGAVSRSAMLCDWLVSAMGTQRWQGARRGLEVGAGWGALLEEFARRFPNAAFEGLELNQAAAALAGERGLTMHQGALEALETGQYDLVYSVAALEHVPSPTFFLVELHKRLRAGGWLFLCQPTQDIPSYDLFFIDHIHHFGSEHLRQYARKTGFREQGLVVGHEWMPNFSLHLWQKVAPEPEFTWAGRPGYTTCETTANEVMGDMRRLDTLLAKLSLEGKRVAVFGLNEVYWLARAYSTLGEFPLVCGLDDTPGKPEYAQLEFPVVAPEDCLSFGVQAVILAMNKVYYPQARQRLEPLGLTVYPVLGETV